MKKKQKQVNSQEITENQKLMKKKKHIKKMMIPKLLKKNKEVEVMVLTKKLLKQRKMNKILWRLY
jgi:hypothetical protein